MYTPMGLIVSLMLIAAGAILVWAVGSEPEGLNIDAVGVVLIVVGIVGFFLSLIFWSSWGPAGYRRRTYVEGDGYAPVEAPRRRRVVEEEHEVGPVGGPPPP